VVHSGSQRSPEQVTHAGCRRGETKLPAKSRAGGGAVASTTGRLPFLPSRPIELAFPVHKGAITRFLTEIATRHLGPIRAAEPAIEAADAGRSRPAAWPRQSRANCGALSHVHQQGVASLLESRSCRHAASVSAAVLDQAEPGNQAPPRPEQQFHTLLDKRRVSPAAGGQRRARPKACGSLRLSALPNQERP